MRLILAILALSTLTLPAICGAPADFVPTLAVVERPGYLSCYDPVRGAPFCVVFELGPGLDGDASREGVPFYAEEGTASPKAFVGSGLHLGHCFAAEDADLSAEMMHASMSMRNIMAQYGRLNVGDWKELELLLRNLALTHRLVVVCGPVFDGPAPRVIGGTVAVPDACFKVCYDLTAGMVTAWIFPNLPDLPNRHPDDYVVPLSEVERRTGLHFKEEI